VLEAQEIVIRSTVHGHVINGQQGGSREVCGLFGLFCSTQTTPDKSGITNVSGIVQYGSSVLKTNKIVLSTQIHGTIENKDGVRNYHGILQIGP
jgi:hypothetical protein